MGARPFPMNLRQSAALFPTVGLLLLCRYTVRDVAFVDFGDEGYTLRALVSSAATPELGPELARTGGMLFLDSNVSLDVTDVDEDPAGHVADFMAGLSIAALPAAVLVGADGRALVLPFPTAAEDTAARMLALDAAVSSPARREVRDGAIDHYGVVLLVEGSDEDANRAAAAVIDKALAEVRSVFDASPKDVGEPPVQVTVASAERGGEAIFLWSLGLEDLDPGLPAVAVFMGRGRRVGPVMRGPEVTPASVFGLLSVIGQDCECDLDRKWMQGPRPPLRWDTTTRERAAARLGFDPGSPLVRSEMLGILARGPGGRPRASEAGRSIEELLLGYEEVLVEDLGSPTEDLAPPPPAVDPRPADHPLPAVPVAPEDPAGSHARAMDSAESGGRLMNWLFPLSCIGVPVLGVLAIGIVLLVVRKKR